IEHKGHKSSHHHHENHHANVKSEVDVLVHYENNLLTIELKDKAGNAPTLELSHVKIFNLIIVSFDLKQYYHLHPVDKGNGIFQQEINLTEGLYKVFADITPQDLNYKIEPIDLQVGSTEQNNQASLQPDTTFQKTINDITVKLEMNSLVVNEPTTLDFQISGGQPEPYLGALGHVIIIDEDIEQFIHVHPESADKTVFHTQFTEPGIYKIWGEFKFDGEVLTFPFVIEVK